MKTSPPVVFVLGLMVLPFAAQAQISWGETIIAGSTQIKADHINEIRSEISNLESQLNGAGQWADGTASSIYYNGGNVGIGTVNPESRLDVRGNVKIQPTINGWGQSSLEVQNTSQTYPTSISLKAGNLGVAGGSLLHTGTSYPISNKRDSTIITTRGVNGLILSAFDGASSAGIRFETSGETPGEPNPKMIIKNSGNVGIGTTSPAAKLHVVSGAGEVLNLHQTANGTGARIKFSDQSSGGQHGFLEYVHTDTQSYGSGNAFKIRGSEPSLSLHVDGKILATGNVGIGTTSPTHKLDIRGPIRNDHTSSSYDLWIQGGSATSGDNRNLAFLGKDENSGDELIINYNREYADGVGIGVTSVANGLELDVGGRVGATHFCDENGNNCVDASTGALNPFGGRRFYVCPNRQGGNTAHTGCHTSCNGQISTVSTCYDSYQSGGKCYGRNIGCPRL